MVELVLPQGFDDRAATEARDRGYLSHVCVRRGDGRFVPVVFYDIVRLRQDTEDDFRRGTQCVGEPGLIIVPEVTIEAMRAAVERLDREDFFEYFRGMSAPPTKLEFGWPPPLD
jgi:hypothetical protein